MDIILDNPVLGYALPAHMWYWEVPKQEFPPRQGKGSHTFRNPKAIEGFSFQATVHTKQPPSSHWVSLQSMWNICCSGVTAVTDTLITLEEDSQVHLKLSYPTVFMHWISHTSYSALNNCIERKAGGSIWINCLFRGFWGQGHLCAELLEQILG